MIASPLRVRLFAAGTLLCSAAIPLGAQRPAARSSGTPPADPPYVVAATLPPAVDGRFLSGFEFDPVTEDLYALTDRALYRLKLTEKPDFGAPIVDKVIWRMTLDRRDGRLFYATEDEIGYLDVRTPGARPVTVQADVSAISLAYAQETGELFASLSREPRVLVFDGRTGARRTDIALPGWYGAGLTAAPRRVFLQVAGESGLYWIDPVAHEVQPWPMPREVVTPAFLDADPGSRFLVVAYDHEFLVFDVASARVIGRVVTPSRPTIAFDPETDRLIASWDDDPPPGFMASYKVTSRALVDTGRIRKPSVADVEVRGMPGGFIQRAGRGWLVWRAGAGASR
ncbi:MAG: hypothetical protein R2752_21600 [Vicinamibacterales bacterium]